MLSSHTDYAALCTFLTRHLKRTFSQSLKQSGSAAVRKGQPSNNCTVMYIEREASSCPFSTIKHVNIAKTLNRRVSMFRCCHWPPLRCSPISNWCQGKGKSGREWMVSRGKAGGCMVAEDEGDGCHIANHQTKQ